MTTIKMKIDSYGARIARNLVVISEDDVLELQGECGRDFDGPVIRLHQMIITWEDDMGGVHADAFTISEE